MSAQPYKKIPLSIYRNPTRIPSFKIKEYFTHVFKKPFTTPTATPDDIGQTEFLEAKAIWSSISAIATKVPQNKEEKDAYKKIMPKFNYVMKLLKSAADKKHFEAARCDAALIDRQLTIKGIVKNIQTQQEFLKFYSLHKANYQNIYQRLDKPQFASDPFSAVLVYQTLQMECFVNRQLSVAQRLLSNAGSLPLAFLIIKAKEYDYSVPNIERALQKAAEIKQAPDAMWLSVLVFPEILNKLKSRSLSEAKQLLTAITPLKPPLECDFLKLETPPDEQVRHVISLLTSIATKLESQGNTNR